MRLPSFDPHHPPRALVVGDLMIDRYLWGSCDRVSPEAPVQVVRVDRETYSLGGAGNVLANLHSFGAQVELIAIVGNDVDQTPLARLLRERGVSGAGLLRDPTRQTTLKTRVLAAHHQLLRFDVESSQPCAAEVASAIGEAAKARLPQTDVVIISDYGKGAITPALARSLIDQCRERGVPILIDPKGRDYQPYRGATLLTPNRKEAATATGLSLDTPAGVSLAGRKLVSDCALEHCLITLSEDGMALFDATQEFRLLTEAREVFDVTGAGDTVIAAIAFGLATGLSMLDACRFANRAAGIVVGKLGSATVTLAEVAGSEQTALAPSAKLLELEALLPRIAQLKAAGKRIVFTNGCFDILHAGHVEYLSRAAELGDVLVVGLNSDASVRRLKGETRPINSLADRALLLAALSAVGYVVPFEQDTPLALIEQVVPHVLVKGGDYRPDDIVGAKLVRDAGGSVQVLPFVPGKSTTAILQRLAEAES